MILRKRSAVVLILTLGEMLSKKSYSGLRLWQVRRSFLFFFNPIKYLLCSLMFVADICNTLIIKSHFKKNFFKKNINQNLIIKALSSQLFLIRNKCTAKQLKSNLIKLNQLKRSYNLRKF